MASDPLSPYLEKLLSFPLTQPSSMLQSSTLKYDALVLGGNVPMDVLAMNVDDYVARTKAAG